MTGSSKTEAFPRVKIRRSAKVDPPSYRRALFVLLVPFSLLLTELAARNPQGTEQAFSRGLYPALAGFFGRIFGVFPFSVAEFLLYGLIIIGAVWLVIRVYSIVTAESKRRELFSTLATLACVGGIGFFAFTMFCGLNYHRVTFGEQSGLVLRPSSAQELAALYTELAEQAAEARLLVAETEDGIVSLGAQSSCELAEQAPQAMALLARRYPQLGGYTPRPKPVLASKGMSLMDITGIYIPFTFEANANVDVVAYNIPFAMMHELAHFKGFMREDEANFIAFLACREAEDPAFLYSGYALALIHTGNALLSADPQLYLEASVALPEAIRLDFAANSAYWKQFEGPVAVIASAMNDTYLKTNRQVEGLRSYGRMVDLLLADYRDRHGLE